jgi:hypothetical protein
LCYRKALYPCFLRFPVSSDYIFQLCKKLGTHSWIFLRTTPLYLCKRVLVRLIYLVVEPSSYF